LENMDDPFADQKSTKENQVISNIKEYALPIDKSVKSTAETSFDFDSRTGTYEWDNDASQWSYEDNSQDEIIIVFPADSTNMGENNATLTIDNYEDQEIDDGDSVYYQPTAIEADLVIDGEEHVNLNMTAEWDDTNGDPLALNASVFLNPFTFTGDIETTSKSGSIDFAIDYDDTQIFSTGIDVDFKDDTKEEPTLIDGYIQYREMNIEANINVENIEQIIADFEAGDSDFDSMDAINDEIDAKLFHDGKKVADIEIGGIDEETDEPTIILVFNDGTEENAEQYFDDFATRIEEFFQNMSS
ncbi:MAG: hypothetical protein ACOC8S_06345, partial [Bacteroidota bacterium]